MTFGTVATALGYPIFTALSIVDLARGAAAPSSTLATIGSFVNLTVFVFGFLAVILPAIVALKRRGLYRLLPLVPMLPFYYVLVSMAAWRAVWELLRHPFRWNKTDHGRARTSRTGAVALPSRGSVPVRHDSAAPHRWRNTSPATSSGGRLMFRLLTKRFLRSMR